MATTKPTETETLSLSDLHAAHLQSKRKISAETARKLGIVSRGQSIAFETRRNGVLLYRKYRAPPKKFWIEPAGVKLSLWNVDCCQDLHRSGGTLIISEGEMDCAALVEVGYPCVVSVPNGAPARVGEGDIQPENDKLFAYLWDDEFRLIPELGEAQRIILATDGDEPGRVLASELAIRLGIDRCSVVQYPTGCKDANDVLIKHGAQMLRDCIDSALALVPDSLVTWSELPEREEQLALTTGWYRLDPHLKLTFPELVVITGKPGSGKALALNTEVATPYGWTTMRDIQVGDVVYDEHGKECNVTRVSEVMEGRPCYNLKFSDGTEIVADAEHQWFTDTRAAKQSALQSKYNGKADGEYQLKPRGKDQRHKKAYPGVVTTEQIAATLKRHDGGAFHSIPLSGAIEGRRGILPIEPYTLGCWLGDGASRDAAITICENAIVENLRAVGESLTQWSDKKSWGVAALLPKLQNLGLVKNKHIPRVYLRAPTRDRLALLQGLMDTDGYCSAYKGSRACEFVTIKENLAYGFYELVCSLGIKATLKKSKAKLYGRTISDKYRVRFTTTIPVFRLQRKLSRQKIDVPIRVPSRQIISCDPCPSVPVRCIQVDSSSHLFLVTRSFVATHNSRFALAWVQNLSRIHGVRAAYLALEDSANRIKRHALAYANSFAETDVVCPATGMVTRIGKGNEIAWLDEHLRLIGPAVTNEDVRGLPWLFEIIREAACKHFCKILVIDPWNEIEHMWSRGSTESEYIGQALRDLKRLGRRYGITIIIVAHPDKSAGRGEGVDDMTLYSISGGAHWKNKADGGIIVAQEIGELGTTGNTVIKVDKRKDWDVMGKPTSGEHVILGFDKGHYTCT